MYSSLKLLISIVRWGTSKDTLSREKKIMMYVSKSFMDDFFLPAFLIADGVLF